MLRIKKKNLIGALILIILLVFSIKPLLFTYNYFLSKYYLYVLEDSKKSEAYTLKAIRLNQKSYKYVGPGNKLDNLIKEAILDKLNPEFDNEFLNNLLDFLYWQKNIKFFNYIKKKHKLNDYEYIKPENVIKYKDSILKVKDILFKELNIKRELIGDNLIQSPDFEDKKNYLKYWVFSNMSNTEPFGEGAFYVNLNKISSNNVVKVINLFINNKNAKAPARGGIWYKKLININKGYYVFTFDYWTKTGKEKPKFWLLNGITIPWLPCTEKRWKKIIYILNNVNGKIKKLKPLIRMFGKGSMYIDNVCLGKLDVKELNFKGQYWFKTVSSDRQSQN